VRCLLEDHKVRLAHHARCHGRRLLAGHMGGNQSSIVSPSIVSDSLNSDWQKHILASSGYLELGMFDDAALVLEEIAPEDKNRNEVLS
jgi:hypothetical protein